MGDIRWGPREADSELATAEQVLCGGHAKGFEGYLAELASKGQSPCTTVWVKGTLAYRCRTCQVNDASAICVKCFDSNIHRGHDYVIYRSPAGGCCDCGDPAAWKEDGFCLAHRSIKDQLELTVPEDLVDVTHSTVRTIIGQLVKCVAVLSTNEGAEESRNRAVVTTLISFLQEVCGVAALRNVVCKEMVSELDDVPAELPPQRLQSGGSGDDVPWPRLPRGGRCVRMFGPHICGASAFRSIVCKEMYDSDDSHDEEHIHITGEEKTPLQFFLSRLVYMGEDLIEKESTLFLLMLYNHRFKETFSKELIKHYPGFFFPALKDRIKVEQYKALEQSLERVMVQLFNVPNVTLSLVKSDGLLECFVSVLGSIISECADSETGIVHVNRDPITNRLYLRPIGDLRLILSHSAVALHVLNERDDLLRVFLTILSALQWMHQFERKNIPNLEDDNFMWAQPINLEMNMATVVAQLLGSGGPHFGLETEIPSTPETAKAMLKAGRIIIAALTEWLEKDKTAYDDNFEVASSPMSQHIPLHRMCSQLIARLASLPHPSGDLSKSALEDFLQPEEAQDIVGPFMAHPLRVLVWMAQIRGGEWTRQNEDLSRLDKIYRSSYWHDTSLDMDLLMLQYCATFGEARAFISMLKAFKLLGIVLSPPIHKSNQEKVHRLLTRLQEFLRLIVMVVRERRNTGMSEDDYLRYETIQWLCLRDQTYTTLTGSISSSLSLNSHLNDVLKEVAVYHVPKLQERGYYQLKPEYWKEFDALFAHFSKTNLEEAQERALSVGKVENPWRPKTPPPPKKPFDRLPELLHTKACHAVLWSGLHYANMYIHEVAHSTAAESLAVAVLQLITMVLQDNRASSMRTGKEEHMSHQEMLIGQAFTSNDLAKNINESPKHWHTASPPRKSMREMLSDLRSASNSACLVDSVDYIFELLRVEAALPAGPAAETAEAKLPEPSGRAEQERQMLKKQRQATILAQFAARQQAFIAQAETEEGGAEEMMLETDETVQPDSAPSSPLAKRVRTPPVSPRSSTALTFHECALCRGECGADGKAAGWISLAQRYKLPAVMLSRAEPVGSLEEATRVSEEGQTQPGTEGDVGEKASWLTTVTGAEAEGVAFSGPGEIDLQESIHVQCCGHQMHLECFQQYSDSLVKRHAAKRPYEGRGIIDLEHVDYLCPNCRRLANTLLPISAFDEDDVSKLLHTAGNGADNMSVDSDEQEADSTKEARAEESIANTSGPSLSAEESSLAQFWEAKKGIKDVLELFVVQCANVANCFKGQPQDLKGAALSRMLWRVLATNVVHCEVLSRGGLFPPTVVGGLASTSAGGALAGADIDRRDYMIARWGGNRTHWTTLIELGCLAAVSSTLPGIGTELEEEGRTIREWLQLGRRGGPEPVEKSLKILTKLLEDTGVRPLARPSSGAFAGIGGHGRAGAALRDWNLQNIGAEVMPRHLDADLMWDDLSDEDEDEDILDAEWGAATEQQQPQQAPNNDARLATQAGPGQAGATNPPAPRPEDPMEASAGTASAAALLEGGAGGEEVRGESGATAGAAANREAEVAAAGGGGTGGAAGERESDAGALQSAGRPRVNWRAIPIEHLPQNIQVAAMRWRTNSMGGQLPQNLQLAAEMERGRHGGRGVSAGIAEGGVSDEEEIGEAGPQGHGWIGGVGSPPWLARGVVLDVDPFLLLVALLMSLRGVITTEKALEVVRLVFPVAVARAAVAMNPIVEDKSEIGQTGLPVIQAACLSFLRRAAILVEIVCGSISHGVAALGPPLPGPGPPNYAALALSLQLPSLQQVLAELSAVPQPPASGDESRSLLHWWSHDAVDSSWRPPVLRKVPRQPLMAKLPEVFQELLLQTVKQPCKKCKEVPREPAICLVCGELLCCSTRCCSEPTSGECYLHAEHENAGVGMFLLMKSTTLVLMRGSRVCMAPSLYLDIHGEEDVNLRRNQPLHLSRLRVDEVTRLWASAGLDYVSQILQQSQLGATVL